jgi:hypothetical protein
MFEEVPAWKKPSSKLPPLDNMVSLNERDWPGEIKGITSYGEAWCVRRQD